LKQLKRQTLKRKYIIKNIKSAINGLTVNHTKRDYFEGSVDPVVGKIDLDNGLLNIRFVECKNYFMKECMIIFNLGYIERNCLPDTRDILEKFILTHQLLRKKYHCLHVRLIMILKKYNINIIGLIDG
jgi:hypothetical protein